MEKVIAIGLFLLMSCSKDKTIIQHQLTGSLEIFVGEWKLKNSIYKVNTPNNAIPKYYKNFAADSSSIQKCIFNEDGFLKFMQNETLVQSHVISSFQVVFSSKHFIQYEMELDQLTRISLVLNTENMEIQLSNEVFPFAIPTCSTQIKNSYECYTKI